MNWMLYLKTTETCNLNCKHCYTSGTSGPKIYWDVPATTNWLHRVKTQLLQPNDSIHIEFHGGEPFLVPAHEIMHVWEQFKDIHPNVSWGATTNLTFKLTDDIIGVITGPLESRLGTSWDPKIRFANVKQSALWESNVKRLLAMGVDIKLFISVTQDTLDMEPIELLRWIKKLGVQEVAFERLTSNGNANIYPEIFPNNVEQDAWFLKMHHQSLEFNTRTWFRNEFLETIYNKFETGVTGGGTFCRDCEEKILTVNADGNISGCPNSAPEFNYGNIRDDLMQVMNSPERLNAMVCEKSRNPLCYECEVFKHCGGDCHQLAWQGNVCGAPKSLMAHLGGIAINTPKRKIIHIKEV